MEADFDVLLTGDVAQRREPVEVAALEAVDAVVVWMRLSRRKASERAERFAEALPEVLRRIEEGCGRIAVTGHDVSCLDE